MNEIKAIETKYNGYRFRSRTEARWAVMLDHQGITFEYEPEGYVLPDGTCYLPDFLLPADRVWLEVKGADFNERFHAEEPRAMSDYDKMMELVRSSGIPLIVGMGSPSESFCPIIVPAQNEEGCDLKGCLVSRRDGDLFTVMLDFKMLFEAMASRPDSFGKTLSELCQCFKLGPAIEFSRGFRFEAFRKG